MGACTHPSLRIELKKILSLNPDVFPNNPFLQNKQQSVTFIYTMTCKEARIGANVVLSLHPLP
jgi:hypothetical protein